MNEFNSRSFKGRADAAVLDCYAFNIDETGSFESYYDLKAYGLKALLQKDFDIADQTLRYEQKKYSFNAGGVLTVC